MKKQTNSLKMLNVRSDCNVQWFDYQNGIWNIVLFLFFMKISMHYLTAFSISYFKSFIVFSGVMWKKIIFYDKLCNFYITSEITWQIMKSLQQIMKLRGNCDDFTALSNYFCYFKFYILFLNFGLILLSRCDVKKTFLATPYSLILPDKRKKKKIKNKICSFLSKVILI